MSGFIYLRDNALFQHENVIKLGITQNIVDRAATYITGEPRRGIWLQVYEVEKHVLNVIDMQLKRVFKQYHIYHDGGTEFYSREIIYLLASELKKICKVAEWDQLKIESAERTARCAALPAAAKRLFSTLTSERVKQIIKRLRANRKAHGAVIGMRYHGPNEQQREVLAKIANFYEANKAGRIHWACGLGKALLAVLIAQKLKSNIILIGVPSITLQKQMCNEIYKIYPDACLMLINGAIKTDHDMCKTPTFYITTYHSSAITAAFITEMKITVDFKIADEFHHLAGAQNPAGFAAFDKINASRALYLSATPPELTETYGPIIDTRSIRWAIDHKKITDYCLIIANPGSANIEYLDTQAAAKMTMAAMDKYPELTHVLLYTNTTTEAEQASQTLTELKFAGYNRALHSQVKTNLTEELTKFRDAPRGIISCVYMFGEGFDLPQLNGVCVAAPMHSNNRIIQYLLRPNRLLKSNPEKLAHIILPYVNNYDCIKDIIAQMRQIDDHIASKIKPLICNVCNICDNISNTIIINNNVWFDSLKLRLIHSKVLTSGNSTEQDEYNYIKSLNQLRDIKSRVEYFAKLTDDLPDDPETYFKITGVWVSWADFLNVTCQLDNLESWRAFCREKKINSPSEYYKSCDIYDQLPRDPSDLFIECQGLRTEFNKKILRR